MEFARNAAVLQTPIARAGALVRAIRPRQWTKNLIIFLPLFFTVNEAWKLKEFGDLLPLAGRSTLAFAIFCGLSGAVYLVNDVFDLEGDRHHPRKRLRPIASGQLSIRAAWSAAAGLTAAGLTLAFVLETSFGWISASYIGTMLAYTLALKRLMLLDVFGISAGFVLRAVGGAAAISVPVSAWLYACTGLGALFIALGKRRGELALAGERAARQRGALTHYRVDYLDRLIGLVAVGVVLAYSLYAFTADNLPHNHTMLLTVPFVAYGVFRYLHLVYHRDLGESPEDIVITDIPLAITIVSWLATAGTILVVFRT